MRCYMEPVSLDEWPRYEALSYAWGNPFQDQPELDSQYSVDNKWPIAVNDRLLYVTKNLYDALHHLQAPFEPDPDVDARLPPHAKTALHWAA